MRRSRSILLAFVLALGTAPATFAQTAVWPPITDAPAAVRTPGRFVWADLVTNDVGTAAAFYGRVFGWTFETYGPADDDLASYTRVLANGRPIGGMTFGSESVRSTTGGRWVGHVSSANVAATAEGAARGGGAVLVAPRTLGERGTVALLRDPTGGVFAAIHSSAGDPADYAAADGEWLWIELWTAEPQRAVDFYRALFGYGAVARSEGRGYTLTTQDGVARAGVLRKPDKLPGTAWIPYVRVADVDDAVKKVREAGGRVVVDPRSYRGTRAALFLDPLGAPFAVAEWKR
ncbi:MAG: VOC family protein [Betaproteobacteria bacterium]|jgi:predicted enzyme related to lactoylglutathione lyase|nr:VOC family protein [Betaproteobacteria bacterium]